LYEHQRTLLTRTNYLTERQTQHLDVLWAIDRGYVALEVMWLVYQDLIQSCGQPKKSEGKKLMSRMINSIRTRLPAGLEEFSQLGRTL
jgi:transposase